MKKITEFMKKWWRWLLAGAAVLLAFILGERLKKPVVVVQGPSEKQKDIEEKTKQEEAKLDQKAAEETQKILDQHKASVDALTDEQRKKVDEIKDDPQAVNQYLLDVGKDMRGG